MSDPKADKHNGVAAFPSDDRMTRKLPHPTSSRSDILSKLVKLVGLSEYRGSKPSTTRCEAGRAEGLIVVGEQAHSPVTVDLVAGDFSATKGEKSLRRSSSDSRLSVSVASDFKGPDLSLIFAPAQTFKLDSSRTDKKSIRRKPKHSPLTEPVTPLTPIPEMMGVFERTSLLPDLSCVNISNFADQDALMETDSIRARAAIAMARAQLEHSRPASYSRKLERSANQMMMLPGELEEYFGGQSSKQREKLSAQLAAHTKNETHDQINNRICEDDVGAMRKAVGQSQAMVLTLMAAKEAISQRASTRKNHHSSLASSSINDLSKRPNKPFQGLYRAGDIPPSPPPSIPLPQLPPMPSLENLDIKSTTPRPESSLRHEIAPSGAGGAYKGLPTEYSTDDEILKHIDALMQSLASSDSKSSETDRRRPYSSLPSRRGRRSNENSVVDSARREHQKKSIESVSRSTSYLKSRHDTNCGQPSRSRHVTSPIPPVPALPRLPAKSAPSISEYATPTLQPSHGVKVENFSVTEMNDDEMPDQCNFVLSSYNDFGELTHTTRVSYPRSPSHKSSLPNVPSGHTEKYFQRFTPHSSSRHPTLPRFMKLGQYIEPSVAVSSPGRGATTLSTKASTSSANTPSCPPGIASLGFFRNAPSIRIHRSRTPEPTPQQTVRLY